MTRPVISIGIAANSLQFAAYDTHRVQGLLDFAFQMSPEKKKGGWHDW